VYKIAHRQRLFQARRGDFLHNSQQVKVTISASISFRLRNAQSTSDMSFATDGTDAARSMTFATLPEADLDSGEIHSVAIGQERSRR
jgi:hypothetical protein